MTTVRLCDGCGAEITQGSRVHVEVRIKGEYARLLDFHTKEDCLLELPNIVKKLQREVRV